MATWTERIKAALNGDVAGGDVMAMLASTTPLDALHQQLDDRRLSARIAHVGEEWRVCLDVAPIAAPLWLGDSLVTLVQALVEAEAAWHADQSGLLSEASHSLAVAALQATDSIITEVSAALVDPARPSRFTALLRVGPRGEIAALPFPDPLPPGYANGLLLAAERVIGAAGLLRADVSTLVQRSPAPPWLTAGLRHVEGELAADGTRLSMLRTRLNQAAAGVVPATVGQELWSVLNAALQSGQQVANPRQLPGALLDSARPSPAAAASPARGASPDVPVARPAPSSTSPEVPPARGNSRVSPTPRPPVPPRAVPEPERVRTLPDIQTVPEPAQRSRPLLAGAEVIKQHDPTSGPADPAALPEIGGQEPVGPSRAADASRPLPRIDRRPPQKDTEARDLPQIGPE